MKRDNLKILTIGNSFTDSLAVFWEKVVESAGCTLHFERANHGGCELHRHWTYIMNEESDNVYRMYQNYQYRMCELLAKEPWDVVTIQQASHFSWRYETYLPFAENIYDYIRQYAPQAEIIIQQTWAYRADDRRLWDEWKYDDALVEKVSVIGIELPGEAVKVSQKEMHNKLTEAYINLAKKLNLRIIPTGDAVALSRTNEPVPFKNYAPELMSTLRWPDLPPQAGDVVGNIWWRKNAESGEMELARDTIHLNKRGEYLQACVWFAFLYERPVSEISYVPEMISASDARFLRKIAQNAVNEFKQVKR